MLDDIGRYPAENGRLLVVGRSLVPQNVFQVGLEVLFVLELFFQVDKDLFLSALGKFVELFRTDPVPLQRPEDVLPARGWDIES